MPKVATIEEGDEGEEGEEDLDENETLEDPKRWNTIMMARTVTSKCQHRQEHQLKITNSQDLRHCLAFQASWWYHQDDTMSLPAVGAIELSLIRTLVFTVVYRRHRFANRNYEGTGNPDRQPKQVTVVSVLNQVPSFSIKWQNSY
jgi:hypothetical protein